MSNLYSQPWFLNEIEKIKSQNLKNLKIDHHKIKLLLQFFMKLDSRDPLKISNENWLYKILKNLEKEPFSLEKNFIDFNRHVDIPVNFDEYLFYSPSVGKVDSKSTNYIKVFTKMNTKDIIDIRPYLYFGNEKVPVLEKKL